MQYQPIITTGQTPIEALNNYFSNLYPLLFDIFLRIIGAFIIFILGWLIAFLVKLGVEYILRNIRFEDFFKKVKLDQYFKDFSWEERLDKILAEIVFWIITVVFLMVAFDMLGLQIVNSFISQVISYIPRVIAGGLILLAGFLFGELVRKTLIGVFRGLERKGSQVVAVFTKWVIIIFAFLAALSQWGIASDIINTVILGFVFFLALAGGLAFGLGGQDTAREILDNLKKQLR